MRTAPLALPELKQLFVARRKASPEAVLACACFPRKGRGTSRISSAPGCRERRDRAAVVTALDLLRADGAPGAAFAMAPMRGLARADRPAGALAGLGARGCDQGSTGATGSGRSRVTRSASPRRSGDRGTWPSGPRCRVLRSCAPPSACSARSGRRGRGPALPRPRAPRPRAGRRAARARAARRRCGVQPPARAASRRATGSAAAAARAGTCRRRGRPGSPRTRSNRRCRTRR